MILVLYATIKYNIVTEKCNDFFDAVRLPVPGAGPLVGGPRGTAATSRPSKVRQNEKGVLYYGKKNVCRAS